MRRYTSGICKRCRGTKVIKMPVKARFKFQYVCCPDCMKVIDVDQRINELINSGRGKL